MAILNVVVDELPESDVIPAGQYRLRIDNVGDPQTDKNGNEYISVEYAVVEGEYTGRKIFDNYVPIAGRARLRKILAAAGFDKPKLGATDELIGLELDAVVAIRKSEEFGEQNYISVYLMPPVKAPLPPAKGRARAAR